MRKYNTKTITILSLMVALEIVLSRFCSINTWNQKIGLGFIPVAMTAMLYGPLAAGTVGALADLIGALLFPTGVYFPGFTLTAFLNGVIFGVFLYPKQSLPRIIGASVLKQIFCTLLLNSYWLSCLYGSPFTVLFLSRLPQAGISFVAEVLILSALARLLPRIQTKVFGSERERRQRQRSAGLQAANAMTEEQRRNAEEKILKAIASSEEWKRAKTVLFYVPLPGEAALQGLLPLANGQNKCLVVPGLSGNNGMTVVSAEDPAKLPEGQSSCIKAGVNPDLSSVDLVLTPCVAFDRYGNYLGRADKFYEKLLEQCRRARVAGCAYHGQKLNWVTANPGTVPLDRIFTEKETLSFSRRDSPDEPKAAGS